MVGEERKLLKLVWSSLERKQSGGRESKAKGRRAEEREGEQRSEGESRGEKRGEKRRKERRAEDEI